ncbi:MAG TPA: FtsQ-type POTRA domain-containing protein [Firmicutes bacterium]|nr:FtsQ-type POTRA domain-containing protein [Bacillota bacterium]
MKNEVPSGKNALYVLVLAVVIAFYLYTNSSFFETDHLEWTGLVYLEPQQLDLYLEFPSVNVWRLDVRDLAAALKEHPWVAEAKVRWRWPNKIEVIIQEREPLAQIPAADGWYLLDKEGNLLPPTLGSVVYSLPIVTGLDPKSSKQRTATARLLAAMPESLKEYVSEWNVTSRSFVSRSGTVILMGQQADLEEKFLLLETILDDLALQNVHAERIDLRVPKNPVVSVM